jgi:hypothetical protein
MNTPVKFIEGIYTPKELIGKSGFIVGTFNLHTVMYIVLLDEQLLDGSRAVIAFQGNLVCLT